MPVPPGFVVPADALEAALADTAAAIRAVLARGEAGEDLAAVSAGGDRARARGRLRRRVPGRGRRRRTRALGDVPVAVRSSATAEDSEEASFAGQQETYLHVHGVDGIVERIRDCWCSFFTERALFYRSKKGSLSDLGMAVVVQRMVEPDVAGVLFTIDPTRGRRDRMLVEAVFGLGEGVVSGQLTPDHFVLARDGRVKRTKLSPQPYKIVAARTGGTREVELRARARARPRRSREDQLARLAAVGLELEERLGGPQDIEWAIQDDEIFVLQSRPVTA